MRSGFSLVEVLVTLALASVSTAAVGHSTRSLLDGRRASDAQQAATLIAERRMEELLAMGADELGAEDSTSTVTDPSGTFAVRAIIEGGPRDNLWHLSVTATPAGNGAPVRFHTLLRRRWALG